MESPLGLIVAGIVGGVTFGLFAEWYQERFKSDLFDRLSVVVIGIVAAGIGAMFIYAWGIRGVIFLWQWLTRPAYW